MNLFTWAAGCSLVAILALWTADHLRQERDAALKAANWLKNERDSLAARNRELVGVLADNAALQEKITNISRVTQQLNMSLDQQSSLINHCMEELKRNDKKMADYLGSAVSNDLGLRYARPEQSTPLRIELEPSVCPLVPCRLPGRAPLRLNENAYKAIDELEGVLAWCAAQVLDCIAKQKAAPGWLG